MRLAVIGAAGRMGRTIVRILQETDGAAPAAALERAGSDAIGADAGELAGVGRLGLAVRPASELAEVLRSVDGVIDFTAPAASVALAEMAAEAGCVHVIGTTGFSPKDEERIAAASRRAAVVKSGNMSLGVNLLVGLVEQAARALGPDAFDIEVLEMHHRHKVDAPSGTALLLGRAAAEGRSIDLEAVSVRSRDGHTGPRPAGVVGFATLRGGSVVGDHQVIFAGEGERIELGHRAEDRSIFARGAVRAALWAQGKAPGLYSMRDVLGLNG